ncbi:MAG: hypothetical protein K8R10_07700 [Rhodocyclales bacterium]|nr:hypothetical protein [Rhodocyclales bacterium]
MPLATVSTATAATSNAALATSRAAVAAVATAAMICEESRSMSMTLNSPLRQ